MSSLDSLRSLGMTLSEPRHLAGRVEGSQRGFTPPFSERAGFTLMEMLIVVVILSILAAIALPTYNRAVEQGRWRTARDILEAVYSGERVFWTTNSKYTNVAKAGSWDTIYMENPNGGALPATFKVTGATKVAFLATATRNGGGCNAKTITIQQDRTIGGTWPANGAC